MVDLLIRPVGLTDLSDITRIYSRVVLSETASWELTPPDEAEMQRRMTAILEAGFPYFVATVAGKVAGYSYANHYRLRPGYRFVVEDSIYVDCAYQRMGIASRLLTAVIDACTAQGKRQMIAVIGDSTNHGSIALHQRLGFEHSVCLPAIGFKFGRWLDSVMMQRTLGEGSASLPEQAVPEKADAL